ncbi:isocitrate lyase/PEP mutase family protein [Roseomonas chloroacetimidivorans]|uniref:isocitrate lyase/PEP mutase family protein n=1 Tax=Roseomonas chloroacetimidivorans TaxID=1766656 RepID=UPI003C76171B
MTTSLHATLPARLRARLRQPEPLIAPGAFECITARLAEQAGFECVYMTGAGTSATAGFPDYGLLTMTEMAANVSRMASSISVPLIVDGDAGYGNELNVFRTVREFERAGAAGLHIEDQEAPKRCGHLEGKEVIPVEAYQAKIRAAVDARTDPDFLIIARTDARAVTGYQDAIARARAAIDAGADMAFVEALQTKEEVLSAPSDVGAPCLLNIVYGGKTPPMTAAEICQAGYNIAILPGLLLSTTIKACDEVLAVVRGGVLYPPSLADMQPTAIFGRVGAAEWDVRRTRYIRPGEAWPRKKGAAAE